MREGKLCPHENITKKIAPGGVGVNSRHYPYSGKRAGCPDFLPVFHGFAIFGNEAYYPFTHIKINLIEYSLESIPPSIIRLTPQH